MTVNRTCAISEKRELLPVLWVHVKAFVQPLGAALFKKRKKTETSYFLSYLGN